MVMCIYLRNMKRLCTSIWEMRNCHAHLPGKYEMVICICLRNTKRGCASTWEIWKDHGHLPEKYEKIMRVRRRGACAHPACVIFSSGKDEKIMHIYQEIWKRPCASTREIRKGHAHLPGKYEMVMRIYLRNMKRSYASTWEIWKGHAHLPGK